jgi:hypothetical protein
VTETLTIPAGFNGPPASANGGVTCGLVAERLGAEAATVSLRAPPPLDRPLAVVCDEGRVEVRDEDTLVATGVPAELLMEMPDAVSPDKARAASRAGRGRWVDNHPTPTCVVCGPDRREDGFGVTPGRLGDELYAADWTPGDSLGDGEGHVRPEFVWAALDCPTSAPVADFEEGQMLVLAALTARLGCPVRVGEPHAIVSWPLGVDGRKRQAGAALFDS